MYWIRLDAFDGWSIMNVFYVNIVFLIVYSSFESDFSLYLSRRSSTICSNNVRKSLSGIPAPQIGGIGSLYISCLNDLACLCVLKEFFEWPSLDLHIPVQIQSVLWSVECHHSYSYRNHMICFRSFLLLQV